MGNYNMNKELIEDLEERIEINKRNTKGRRYDYQIYLMSNDNKIYKSKMFNITIRSRLGIYGIYTSKPFYEVILHDNIKVHYRWVGYHEWRFLNKSNAFTFAKMIAYFTQDINDIYIMRSKLAYFNTRHKLLKWFDKNQPFICDACGIDESKNEK